MSTNKDSSQAGGEGGSEHDYGYVRKILFDVEDLLLDCFKMVDE